MNDQMHQDIDLSPQGTEVIKKKVLHELGEPNDLLKIDIMPLWNNKCRVNVWRSEDSGMISKTNFISDSFFININESGHMEATPEIVKKY